MINSYEIKYQSQQYLCKIVLFHALKVTMHCQGYNTICWMKMEKMKTTLKNIKQSKLTLANLLVTANIQNSA